MQKVHKFRRPQRSHPRRGSILVLAAAVMVMVFAFTAFAVDVGYIAMTRSQLQSATDAAALAACQELPVGLDFVPTSTPSQIMAAGQSAAITLAGLHKAGDASSVYLDSSQDLQFGQRTYNPLAGGWQISWGTTPYNVVKVTSHRDRATSTQGDKPLDLFFAPVVGHNQTSLSTTTVVGLTAAVGFRLSPSSSQTVAVLPIAYDLPSWNAFLAGSGTGGDSYSYDPSTKMVNSGSDGVREFDLYPYGNQDLTSGNRGTVDFGGANNSTADLKRQIVYGLNASDLAHFNGTFRLDQGPISLNGDTGISAGMEESLLAIKGQTRVIPIFSSVTGPGNNAVFTIVKFVGIRIMDVRLTGGAKRLVVQPAIVTGTNFVSGTSTSYSDFMYTMPRILQ